MRIPARPGSCYTHETMFMFFQVRITLVALPKEVGFEEFFSEQKNQFERLAGDQYEQGVDQVGDLDWAVSSLVKEKALATESILLRK